MLVLVFVKKNIRSCFSEIKLSAAGAGIMGLMVFINLVMLKET